jgi:hypothetical protein
VDHQFSLLLNHLQSRNSATEVTTPHFPWQRILRNIISITMRHRQPSISPSACTNLSDRLSRKSQSFMFTLCLELEPVNHQNCCAARPYLRLVNTPITIIGQTQRRLPSSFFPRLARFLSASACPSQNVFSANVTFSCP